MGFAETGLVYALIGVAVGIALALREKRRRVLLFLAGLFFWPVFAPFLLSPGKPPEQQRPVQDARVQAAQDRVLRALARLDGLAEEVVAPEMARVRGLAGAMGAMSRRIAEMDELLSGPELNEPAARALLQDLAARGVSEKDPRQESVKARLRNIERLRAMRDRTREDLERILYKLEEMSTQLHLLKFAGRPEAEVVRAIKEVAESVEGITEGLLADEAFAPDAHAQ